jgi:hypothetical protein
MNFSALSKQNRNERLEKKKPAKKLAYLECARRGLGWQVVAWV